MKSIRLDPAGDNTPVEKCIETAEWKDLQPIDSEFTSCDTPQHNNLAELSFPYIAGIVSAMASEANIHTGTRGKKAIQTIKCATQLDGLVIVKVGGESKARDMHVYDKLPKWTRNMRTFGEVGVVKEGKDAKTDDREIEMVFVGYPFNRESDSVRMRNPGTNRVYTS